MPIHGGEDVWLGQNASRSRDLIFVAGLTMPYIPPTFPTVADEVSLPQATLWCAFDHLPVEGAWADKDGRPKDLNLDDPRVLEATRVIYSGFLTGLPVYGAEGIGVQLNLYHEYGENPDYDTEEYAGLCTVNLRCCTFGPVRQIPVELIERARLKGINFRDSTLEFADPERPILWKDLHIKIHDLMGRFPPIENSTDPGPAPIAFIDNFLWRIYTKYAARILANPRDFRKREAIEEDLKKEFGAALSGRDRQALATMLMTDRQRSGKTQPSEPKKSAP